MNIETEKDVKSVKAIPQLGIEARKLIQVLEKGKPGDVFTDEEMTAICGRDTRPNHNGYGYLQTALRYCRKNGILWERQRKEFCVKCLNSTEAIDSMDNDIKGIGRRARHTKYKTLAIDYDTLSTEQKSAALVKTAQLGGLELMASKSTQKKMLADNIIQTPDTKQLLAAFRTIE